MNCSYKQHNTKEKQKIIIRDQEMSINQQQNKMWNQNTYEVGTWSEEIMINSKTNYHQQFQNQNT